MHIREFQKLMRELYYERDSKRGKQGTLDWLKDEVEELKEAVEESDKKSVEEEFADVLAWLASLANLADIDLEKAAFSKYPNKCPKCSQNPCNCQF